MKCIHAILALILFGLLACNSVESTPCLTGVLYATVAKLQSECPEVQKWLSEIPYPIVWELSNCLPEGTLATTTVYNDSALIKVNVGAVRNRRDYLEPILAHEIYHVWDAYNGVGVVAFKEHVAKSQKVPWKHRLLEQRATAAEHRVRVYLLTNYPKAYRCMPLHRDLP